MTNQSAFSLSCYKGFLLDVDGVLVWDDEVIPGAIESVKKLRSIGKVLFLSNSASLSQAGYEHKLSRLGFCASECQILNSSVLAARYLSERSSGAKVFVLGPDGLREEIARAGHTLVDCEADWMVTGTDQALTYEKLTQGLRVMESGAQWVAANADATYMGKDGLKPGAGSVVGAFRGMGFEPEQIVGKPSAYCMSIAAKHLGVEDPTQILAIGDRLDSDIEGAQRIGAHSALLLSGVTQPEILAQSDIQPLFVFDDLADLVDQHPSQIR